MKKKLIITLTATLIVVQGILSSSISADTNENNVQAVSNNVEEVSQNQNKEYTNDIFIRGIDVQSHKYHGAYIKFDVSDPQNKKLKVTDMLGPQYQIHPNFRNNIYFSVKLYGPFGNLKASVELKGYDDLSKLNNINNTSFEYGDYLKISVAQQNALRINGNIIDNKQYKGDVIPKWVLDQNHYEITEAGLRLVYETGEVSESKETYWNENKNEFSLNVRFGKGTQEFGTDLKHELVVRDQSGQIVDLVKGYATNRYAEKPSNFDGSQFILTEEILKKLNVGTYTFGMRLSEGDRQCFNTEINQNEIKGTPGKYSDINKTGSRVIDNKEYKFKTENSKTGRIILEVTEKSTQN